MTTEEKRRFMLQVAEETNDKAEKCGLFYVICFWMSPITDRVEYRRAYFDEVTEGISYETTMMNTYNQNFRFKYYITTNMLAGDTDGGLLDD